MHIDQPGIYHIYNRGNFRQQLFFEDRHYKYFLTKCHLYIKPKAEILAWCLMPNHFHFLVYVTEISLAPVQVGAIVMPAITNGFRLLQSSYAKGLNKEQGRTGNLFQQKTKAICVNDGKLSYSVTALHYIHQNPLKASLVKNMEAWEFSSFIDYVGMRKDDLCNKELACLLLDLNSDTLYEESYKAIPENTIKLIM